MQEEQIIYLIKNFYNKLLEIFIAHTAEFIFGVLALSIGVVIISIIYVLIYNENKKRTDAKEVQKERRKLLKSNIVKIS